jgi:hypothetical protein
MHVGPSGASVIPVTPPAVIDRASTAVTSLQGLIDRTPALLWSSDEDAVDRTCCTWWPRVTRSVVFDAVDELLGDDDRAGTAAALD